MMAQPVFGVFVPALMAVGILVSGAVVAAEWVAGLLPSRAIRRRQAVAHDALGTVARVADVIDADVSLFSFAQRQARARRAYVFAAIVFAGLGLLTVRFGVDMYVDPLGWLYDDEWMLVVGYGIGGFLLLIGLVSLVPAAVSLQSAVVVRALIEKTWLGKPVPPPDDPSALIDGNHEEEVNS
jgi:hypothetical protein